MSGVGILLCVCVCPKAQCLFGVTSFPTQLFFVQYSLLTIMYSEAWTGREGGGEWFDNLFYHSEFWGYIYILMSGVRYTMEFSEYFSVYIPFLILVKNDSPKQTVVSYINSPTCFLCKLIRRTRGFLLANEIV